jgi:predicted tellurium resistance membrane protein TerC
MPSSMLELFSDPQVWASLLTLTILEVVLGIDNLVFISILTGRLPVAKQKRARQFGLMLACVTRLILLAAITWITKLIHPVFNLFGHVFSWRDLILIAGGLFLLAKSTSEIHVDMSNFQQAQHNKKKSYAVNFIGVLIQIMLLDIIFSLDSVITAVGLAQEFLVMAAAIIIAVLLMILASEPLGRFIQAYPTLKMLALSFLLLVGMVLVADGFSFHVPRGYLYFAIAFSIFVEILNILAGRRKR